MDETLSIVREVGDFLSDQYAVLSMFAFLSLALPEMGRKAINIRRALRRYDAQLTNPGPAKQANNGNSKVRFGALYFVATLFSSYSLAIVVLNLWGSKKVSFIGEHTFGVAAGVLLFYLLFLPVFFDGTEFVSRTKNKRPGKKPPTLIASLTTIYTQRNPSSPGLNLVCVLLLSAVSGLVTLNTGYLFPLIFGFSAFPNIGTLLPQGHTLRRTSVTILAFVAVCLCGGFVLYKLDSSQSQKAGNVQQSSSTSFVNFNTPSASERYFDAFSLFINLFYAMLPATFAISAARDYDVQRWDETGPGLEGEIALLREDLAESEPRATPTPPLDPNGKRPELLMDGNSVDSRINVGKQPFRIFLHRLRNPDTRLPALELPTFDVALETLRITTWLPWLFSMVARLMARKPMIPSLLFSQQAFETDWTSAGAMYLFFAYALSLVIFLELIVVISVSVYRRHGWSGLNAIWTKADDIWSHGPRSVTFAPEEEAAEEEKSTILSAAELETELLVDVNEK